jgi:hypothetical protein
MGLVPQILRMEQIAKAALDMVMCRHRNLPFRDVRYLERQVGTPAESYVVVVIDHVESTVKYS